MGDYLKALEIQRRNFEAQFGTIEDLGYQDKSKHGEEDAQSEASDEPSDDDEDSNDEDENDIDSDSSAMELDFDSDTNEYQQQDAVEAPAPKVVKLSSFSTPIQTSKADKKLLRLGRAPTLAEIAKKEQLLLNLTKKQQAQAKKEDDDNVENDLKLQRLLLESHILANAVEYSGADVTLQTLDYEDPTGKARRRALDSRIRTAAAINSRTQGLPKSLEKMPMAMRKGMVKARESKVARYEQEARDAGIVLSKVKKGDVRNLDAGRGSTPSSDRLGSGHRVEKRMRDRGLKINAIGRSTRNGLVISQTEIDKINGAGRRGGKGGRGGRGGSRGGRGGGLRGGRR